MAHENKNDLLAQFGPIGAPIAGAVIAVVLIAVAFVTSGVSEKSGKLSNSVRSVNDSLGSKNVAGGASRIPLPDSVPSSLKTAPADKLPADGLRRLMEYPISWVVEMEEPPQDLFALIDTDMNGFITPPEFTAWVKPAEWPTNDPRHKFEEWDRNPKDGQISRAEFADPPVSPRDRFNQLDKDGSEYLTAPDEITEKEAHDWDRWPFDGKISFEEWVDRFNPPSSRDYGPAREVTAEIDPARMVVIVRWQDPEVANLPEGVQYIIERRAPETVAQRQREHGQELSRYQTRFRAWETEFKKWEAKWILEDFVNAQGEKIMVPIPNASEDAEVRERPRTNGEEYTSESARMNQYESATGIMRPSRPAQPTEWEVVATRVSGNEYLDTSFALNVTYTYGVRMISNSPPNRNQPAQPVSEMSGWFEVPENMRVAQAGQPVRVRNRISIGYVRPGNTTATFTLTQWYKQVVAGGEGNTHTWYQVQITETEVESENPIGGNYRASQLRDRALKLIDTDNNEVAEPWTVLPSNLQLDFTTGFRFVVRRGAFLLLSHQEYGSFDLPDATRGPATVVTAPSTSQYLEVRALALRSTSNDGVFEVTGWRQVGETWYRVEWTGTVKKGDNVGANVTFGTSGLKVFDSSGNAVTGSALSALKDETIDLTAGTYDGYSGRAVTIGGEEFDVFGSLYKG